MIANRDWLWDRNISLKKAKSILKQPSNERFTSLAALLLSRKNTPEEVFKIYLKPLDFINSWSSIKRQMRKDDWNDPRIEFWQAIYEKLIEKFRKRGVFVQKKPKPARPNIGLYRTVTDKIRAVRREKGLTQGELAKRLGISQQIISRIESGNENISLLTLKKIVDSLSSELILDIKV